MAFYNYKRVLGVISKDFQEKYVASWKEANGRDFEYTADYDGDLWCMAADYIEFLHNEVAKK